MDEKAFLRHQASAERQRLSEVKNAARAALASSMATNNAANGELVRFAVEATAYLQFLVARVHAQDLQHCAQLRSRLGASDARSLAVLDEVENVVGLSRAALAELEAAGDPIEGLQRYVEFLDQVPADRQSALIPLLDQYYDIDDWRAASFTDADTILDERARYAMVQTALPHGITL